MSMLLGSRTVNIKPGYGPTTLDSFNQISKPIRKTTAIPSSSTSLSHIKNKLIDPKTMDSNGRVTIPNSIKTETNPKVIKKWITYQIEVNSNLTHEQAQRAAEDIYKNPQPRNITDRVFPTANPINEPDANANLAPFTTKGFTWKDATTIIIPPGNPEDANKYFTRNSPIVSSTGSPVVDAYAYTDVFSNNKYSKTPTISVTKELRKKSNEYEEYKKIYGKDPKTIKQMEEQLKSIPVQDGSWNGKIKIVQSNNAVPVINRDTKALTAPSTSVKQEATTAMKNTSKRTLLTLVRKVGNLNKANLNKIRNTKMLQEDKLAKNVYPSGYTEDLSMKIGSKPIIKIYPDNALNAKSVSKNNTLEYNNYLESGVKYIDCFLLTGVDVTSEEKMSAFSPLDGSSDMYWFTGQKAPYLSLRGRLLNSNSQQWVNDFMYYYENYLRGSKAIKNRSKTAILFEDQHIEGYFLNCRVSQSNTMPNLLTLNMNIVVTKKTIIGGWVNPLNRESSKPPKKEQPLSPTQYAAKTMENILTDVKNTGLSYFNIITSASGLPNVEKFMSDISLSPKVIRQLNSKNKSIERTQHQKQSISTDKIKIDKNKIYKNKKLFFNPSDISLAPQHRLG